MRIDFGFIEAEGRTAIIEGLDRADALHELAAALDNDAVDSIDLDLTELDDNQLKVSCGLFYSLSAGLDLERFLRTFEFSFTLFQELLSEIRKRGLEYTLH
jgi:hypothetical protein